MHRGTEAPSRASGGVSCGRDQPSRPLTNRRQRRAQYRPAVRSTTAEQRRNRFRILVLLAVFGLIMLAVASFGAVSVPPPTPSPVF